MNQKILNAKEKKEIINEITKQWGVSKDLLKNYVFLKSAKDKIYLSTQALSLVNLEKLRIDNIGLYFCTLMPESGVRLSIEGSQLIGEEATRNVLVLGKEDIDKWMKGEDIELSDTKGCEGFVIVKYKETNDFVGCGKIRGMTLLNFVPKTRRVKELA